MSLGGEAQMDPARVTLASSSKIIPSIPHPQVTEVS